MTAEPTAKRRRTAPRFPSSPALDAPTLGALQSAVEGPGARAPGTSLQVISTMLAQTVSEVKEMVEASTRPSHHTLMYAYAVEGYIGRPRNWGVDAVWLRFIAIPEIDLAYSYQHLASGAASDGTLPDKMAWILRCIADTKNIHIPRDRCKTLADVERYQKSLLCHT